MSWRFRTRVKIIPGVYLNFSKKGISTTIGPRGMSVNFSLGGTTLNASVPRSDLSIKKTLYSKTNQQTFPGKTNPQNEINDKLVHMLEQYHDGSKEIKSESIEQLTSTGFSILKKTIIAAHTEYHDISQLLEGRNIQKNRLDNKLSKLNRSLIKFLFKKRITRLSKESEEFGEELAELEEQKNLSSVELKIQQDETFNTLFQNVTKACQLITGSSKIWDVTTTKDIDRVRQRSFANSEIRRVEVKATVQASGLIVCANSPLKLQNKNGGDLLFYPGFIIVHEQHLDFAILDYSELDIEFSSVQFVETEAVPPDTTIVGHTWIKVNKNGTPDKRFSNNYQIPLTRYAQINFLSVTGLQESFLFSNYKYANIFYESLKNYLSAVKTANSLLNQFNK